MPPSALCRFAPTPSGRMHLGNALTALLCWLSARAQGARLLLRIEDLDPQRTGARQSADVIDDLLWLGLDYDEGPKKGDAPSFAYFQSMRTAFYAQQLEKLEAQGLLYPCFCTRAQLHAASAPHLADGTPRYDGRCRRLTPHEVAQKSARHAPAVRVAVPDETICFTDGHLGPVCENLQKDCGDFIVRRSDGVFAYQLAVAADDGDAGVSEVVRGQDLLGSTARQIWLMRRLGYTAPRYCHTPLLLAPDGRRLSKRDRDLDLGALRARLGGPEPLVGLLAHLAGLLPKPKAVRAGDLVSRFSWAVVHRQNITLEPDFLRDFF